MHLAFVAIALVAVPKVKPVYANEASNLESLVEKFSPILILTEETGGEWGDIRVTKPEPVEIVGADSAANIWLETRDLSGSHATSAPLDSSIWATADMESNQRRWYPDGEVDFAENRFAFLNHRDYKTYYSTQGGLTNGQYSTRAFFEYPGKTPTEWNATYFGSGHHAGENEAFDNTAYVHIYKTTHEAYADSIAVIQYFFFYPYNHWWNNHEGDWQRVHVVASSTDASSAEIIGVEYLFHGAFLSYYNGYSMTFEVPPGAGNSGGETTTVRMPNLTSDFVFNPQRNVRLSQGTHPIVYVGAGSHGGYPVGGRIRVHDTRVTSPLHESMSHTGLVLSTQADDFHTDLWESYDLVVLSEPDRADTLNNMGLPKEMSWLGANLWWGTPEVHPGAAPPGSSNDSAKGPYHKGWENLKYYGQSAIGEFPFRDPFLHSDVPNSYHHWTVIGLETWNETASTGEDTVSLSGDIVVFPGATLTISAGTVIELAAAQDRHQFSAGGTGVDDRTEIFVYGTLVANGTSTDSVRFQKSGTAGGLNAWGGIRKMDGGSVILHHTEIRDTLPGRPTQLQAERGTSGSRCDGPSRIMKASADGSSGRAPFREPTRRGPRGSP